MSLRTVIREYFETTLNVHCLKHGIGIAIFDHGLLYGSSMLIGMYSHGVPYVELFQLLKNPEREKTSSKEGGGDSQPKDWETEGGKEGGRRDKPGSKDTRPKYGKDYQGRDKGRQRSVHVY